MKLKVSIFYLCFLSRVNEADVAVRHHRLDLKLAVARDDHQQRLRRCDDAADGINRELLDHAIHRSPEFLKPGLLLSLDQVLCQARSLFCSSFASSSEIVRAVFGHRLATRLANRLHGSFRFAQMALLNSEFLLLVHELLKDLEIGELELSSLSISVLRISTRCWTDRSVSSACGSWPRWSPVRPPSAPAAYREAPTWRDAPPL